MSPVRAKGGQQKRGAHALLTKWINLKTTYVQRKSFKAAKRHVLQLQGSPHSIYAGKS